jgi:hypothetical protein
MMGRQEESPFSLGRRDSAKTDRYITERRRVAGDDATSEWRETQRKTKINTIVIIEMDFWNILRRN